MKAKNSVAMKLRWQDPEYRAKMAQRRTRRNRIEKFCLYCGKNFTSVPSKVKDGLGKFCSRECYCLSQVGKTPKGTTPAVYVDRICQQCGKSFKLSASLLKRQPGRYCSHLCGNKAKANPADPEVKDRKAKLVSITSKRRWQNPQYVEKLSQTQKVAQRKKWQNPDFVAKMIASLNRKPNKPETRLIDILSHYLPQFQYNGDFSLGVTLGGLIPDFVNVNGKKEVIEILGDYFHSPELVGKRWQGSELGKVMVYNSLGYKCLVLWEHELKQLPDDKLLGNINKFFSQGRR